MLPVAPPGDPDPPPPAGIAQEPSSRRKCVVPAVAPGSGTMPGLCPEPEAVKAGSVRASVPVVVIGEPVTEAQLGTVIATLVTVPEPPPPPIEAHPVAFPLAR